MSQSRDDESRRRDEGWMREENLKGRNNKGNPGEVRKIENEWQGATVVGSEGAKDPSPALP